MTILLIRHGETDANAARVVQTPDIPLNERGLEQARRLGERLGGEPLRLILSSDYERAARTAAHVQQTTGAKLEYEPLLRERHFGEIRGRAYSEIGEDIFHVDYVPPGGESWPEFLERVAQAWTVICARAESSAEPIAVVTHGLLCRALSLHHVALDPGDAPGAGGFRNSSVTAIDARPPHRVRLLNCVAHLDGGEPARGISGI